MPLIRRLPKRGFNNAAFHKTYAVVNLGDLSRFEAGATVNEEALRGAKLIRGNYFGVKILGSGELKHGLTIEADKVSASARQKIEQAGGTVMLRESKAQARRNDATAEVRVAAPEQPAVTTRPARKRAAKKSAE